jgi:hypothetical protein
MLWKRTGSAYFPRQRDRADIGGSGPKTSSASSIFGGRAGPGVEGRTLWLGEGLERGMAVMRWPRTDVQSRS